MPSLDTLLIDSEGRKNPKALQPKIMYAGDEWKKQPYVAVTEAGINVSAGESKTNGIAVSEKFGTTIGGKISFSAMPDQISIGGGYWRLNPLLLSCIPSTTPTPVPTLVKATPRLLSAKPDVEASLSSLISLSDSKRKSIIAQPK